MNFVIFSINNWEKRKARKQQFAIALSQRRDVERVLYVEPALNFWRLIFLLQKELVTVENRQRWLRALTGKLLIVNEKLSVFTPIVFLPFGFRFQVIYNWNTRRISRTAARKAKSSIETILWFYQPLDYKLLEYFKPRKLAVFDWAEEWARYFTEFSSIKREQVRQWEEKIIKASDIVLVVAKEMLVKARKLNPASFYVIDGTVPEMFDQQIVSKEISSLPKPVCGYIGTLSHRVDEELLYFLAQKFRNVSFVFIGDIHSKRFDDSRLKTLPNVIFTGSKEYNELGAYACGVDAWLLPYNPQLTKSFPTKIFDYLATGKPIISTRLEALKDFESVVSMGDSAEDIAQLLEKALNDYDEKICKVRIALARENSWTRRVEQIIGYINGII